MLGRSICLLCSVSRPFILMGMRRVKIQYVNRYQYSSYQSSYSLTNMYPNSSTDITKPLDSLPDDLYTRLQDEVKKESNDETFSGYIPIDKLRLKYSRSSGPGGQNVNKVESKVDMRFHLASAEWLPQHIRDKIQEKKKTKINAAGELVIMSQKTRSQIKNVQDCLLKLREMIVEVQRKPKELSEKHASVLRMRKEKATRERLRQKGHHASTKRDRTIFSDN